MDVEEAIHRLRVVRRFGPKPVSQADLEAILEAGRRTGSSKNQQPGNSSGEAIRTVEQ